MVTRTTAGDSPAGAAPMEFSAAVTNMLGSLMGKTDKMHYQVGGHRQTDGHCIHTEEERSTRMEKL